MADFREMMYQFDRMCKANTGCSNCPLHKLDEVAYRCNLSAFVNHSELIECEVMKWAAEHPEPVYPTWVDWFRQMGVVPSEQKCFHDWLFNQIPADIAEKLGIEPKEG